jgi:hypothetical protein
MTNFSSLVMPLPRAQELATCFIVVMGAPRSLRGADYRCFSRGDENGCLVTLERIERGAA